MEKAALGSVEGDCEVTGFRTKITNVKLKTDATGKTVVVPQQSYTSVSDKLKRGSSKKVKVKRR